MSVDKVILRAVLNTLAAILVLCAFMVLSLTYIFPSTMMSITYDLGMDDASITCAKRAYTRADEVYYIAFATEVAILIEDSEEIADCGLSLIQNESFASYCEQKNAELGAMASGSYEQYVYGQVSVAQYRLGKKTEAVMTAFEAVGSSFPKNNAVVALCLTAKAENDGETLNRILAKMNELESGLSATDKAYFDKLKKVIWG